MIIHQRNDSYFEFINKWNSENCFFWLVFSDIEKRPAINTASVLFVKFVESGESYELPFKHLDVDFEGLNFTETISDLTTSRTTKFTVSKKDILKKLPLQNIIDVAMESYINNYEIFDISEYRTKAHDTLQFSNEKLLNVNEIVPILKHKEMFDNIYDNYRSKFNNKSNTFYDVLIQVFSDIEDSGLKVLPSKFAGKKKNISDTQLVYTDYNFFTSTGRPSNAHGGINFAAINKTDGSRRAFVSRFEDKGSLILFDYDAYHIRLIANELLNGKFYIPTNKSAHRWLAEQYTDNETVSDEDYSIAKEITFKLLYGGIPAEMVENVPFLSEVSNVIDRNWNFINRNGWLYSDISGKKIELGNIEDPNKQKLFNYKLQLLETERNVLVLSSVLELIRNMKSKLILYTYDSFLFDVHVDEKEYFLTTVRNMFVNGTDDDSAHTYPIHISEGQNYNEMKSTIYL